MSKRKNPSSSAAAILFDERIARRPVIEEKREAPRLAVVRPIEPVILPPVDWITLPGAQISPLLHPETGELRIPLDVDPKYRHWQAHVDGMEQRIGKAQSIFETLLDFKATLVSWRRYGVEERSILNKTHLDQCKRHIAWYPEVTKEAERFGPWLEDTPASERVAVEVTATAFICCGACGWWHECDEETHDLLIFLDDLD